MIALETELAKIQWTQVESRDAVKTYNKYPVSKIVAEMPGFDWVGWAKPQGIEKATEWVIGQPSFFKGFAAMVPTVAARHVEGVARRAVDHAARRHT